jgi:hypothetical protein
VIYVTFVVDKVALGQVSSQYFGFALSVPFQTYSIVVFVYLFFFFSWLISR